MKKEITVIGATGNLGAPVVKNLCALGYKMKIVVRDIQKAQQIFKMNPSVQMCQADLEDLPSLKEALCDVSFLYLNLSTTGADMKASFKPEIDGIANILKAVNKNTIKQIILISGLGAMDNVNGKNSFVFKPNHIRKQGQKLIKESGIPYTILHCSWFIDSFVTFQRNGIYTVIGNNKAPIYFTNSYDYSVHLSNAIGNPAAFYREFPVQGKRGLIHSEAAKSFLSLTDKSAMVKIMPYALLRIMAFFIGELRFVRHLAEYSYRCPESFIAEDFGTYEILGRPELNLENYAAMIIEKDLYDYFKA